MRKTALTLFLGGVICAQMAAGDAERTDAAMTQHKAFAAQAGAIGPDVICSQVGLDPGDSFGSFVNYDVVGDWRAYAINTTSCNIGDAPASWRDGTTESPDNRHPVIATNIYRLHEGRFEQIGLGWVKHSFCALSQSQCHSCTAPHDCDWLAVNCSDPYNAGTNGNQDRLGPRYEINPLTGVFPYPADQSAPIADVTSRRLRVLDTDVQAALNPGAQYFFEGQYISSDDSAVGNGLNNVSWREAVLTADGAVDNFLSTTTVNEPAILAWAANDSDAVVTPIDIPGDGRVYLGARATPNGDGSYTYEYAVYNMNADRGIGAVRLPVGIGASVCDVGFRDVIYDAGEPWDGTDWPATVSASEVEWATDDHATDPDANAIRWGTLYNFRFRSNGRPEPVTVELDLFKPGSPALVTTMALGPAAPCPWDCTPDNGDGSFGNGIINIDDLLEVISAFNSVGGPCDVTPQNADCSIGNGSVNIDDLLETIGQFGPCP